MEEKEKDNESLQDEVKSSEQTAKPTSEPAVSRRDRRKGKKPNKKIVFIVAIVILIVAVVIFLLREPDLEVEPIAEPTPSEQGQSPTNTPTPEPINREEISIQVLNGTGIGGQAAFLQGELADLGYSDIDIGNADEQDYEETIVTFSASVDESIREEITDRLESLYEDVEVNSDSNGDYDVQIIAGLREGQVLPTETPQPTEAPATPTPTGSITPTPTGTPSPTPTL